MFNKNLNDKKGKKVVDVTLQFELFDHIYENVLKIFKKKEDKEEIINNEEETEKDNL